MDVTGNVIADYMRGNTRIAVSYTHLACEKTSAGTDAGYGICTDAGMEKTV